jgi:hypothetical protein
MSEHQQKPTRVTVRKQLDNVNLIVKGQGIVFFDASGACCLTFCDMSGTPGLKVQFTETNVLVNELPSNEPLVDPQNKKGIVNQRGASYWFSLDAQNQHLYAGIGEARKETAIYTFQWPYSHSQKLFLESLTSVCCKDLELRQILRDPITQSVPLLIKDKDELTMDMLAEGNCIPKPQLTSTEQKLYDCIAGKQFVLDAPDFPEFSQAIEHSIRTPGKWCHEKLKQKATEFDKDKPNEKETYLRITLGANNGESPGIPYVMEIWPSDHFSPIHNHAGASAIIRVLHGDIQVSLFPFLSGDSVIPFAVKQFTKNDITWLSPDLNQIHQLKNVSSKACVTIQCYMYEDENKKHYDYFDYLDGSGKKEQYEPDSDMEFLAFKNQMKKEWLEANPPLPRRSWFC